jgi:hypothetical protein
MREQIMCIVVHQMEDRVGGKNVASPDEEPSGFGLLRMLKPYSHPAELMILSISPDLFYETDPIGHAPEAEGGGYALFDRH